MRIFQMMILALLLSAFGACNNANDDNSPSDSPPVVAGDDSAWRVSYYFDKDKEETSDFAGYRFTFRDDGTLEAVRNGTTVAGTWATTRDDGRQRLVINAGTASRPLESLTDDWVIVEQNASRIRLQDDNDEHLEELHFEKI
ncbi:MAG: hypothetical protein J5I98_00900 [Phaeodactylibacter sp.]|nr:hypothetical protein [Phaeodactylibacter sp.]